MVFLFCRFDLTAKLPGPGLTLLLGFVALLSTLMIFGHGVHGEEPWEALATVDLGSRSQDVAYEGDLALVARGPAGITTLDLSDPSDPVVLGSLDTPDDARGVAFSGQLGLVADHRGGVLVLDLSSADAPAVLANLTFDDPVSGVALHSSYGYVMAGRAGLMVLDLSDPSKPDLVANLTLPGPALAIYVQGHYGLVAMGDSGVALVDLTDPLDPSICSSWSDSNHTRSVFYYRDYGYLAQGSAGMQVLDLSDKKNPQAMDRLSTTDEVYDVVGAGNYLYLANFRDGLGLARTDDPAHPRWIMGMDSDGYGLAVAARKDTVLLADGPAGLKIARALPTATILSISPDPLVVNESVDLDGTGLGFTLITSYRWSSDIQGYLGSLPWIRLDNLSLGTHLISLEVADASGHWSIPSTRELVVTARPVAEIEYTSAPLIQEGEVFQAHGTGHDDGMLVAFEWRLAGQGVVCEDYQCTLKDLAPGEYLLHLRVQDDAGLWSTPDTFELAVNGRPSARIISVLSPVPGGLVPTGEPVTLEAESTDDGNLAELKFNWDSDIQGALGAGSSITLTALQKGKHQITLTVNDGRGGVSRPVTTELLVADRPEAVILSDTPAIMLAGNSLELSGAGLPEGEVVGYRWESDQVGVLSTLPQFLLEELPAGPQNITLTVYTKQGFPSLPVTRALIVNHLPRASIISVTPDPAFGGEPIQLQGEGWDVDGEVVSHRWKMATGPVLGETENLSLSLDPGKYDILYQVRDDLGSWSPAESVELSVLSPLLDQTIHVAPGPLVFQDGSAEYPLSDLQAAFDMAQTGWRIIIHGGSYRGPFRLDKNVQVKGLEDPVLSASQAGTVLTLRADETLLEGLSFTGTTNQTGLDMQGRNLILRNLSFQGLALGLLGTGELPAEASHLLFHDNLVGWSSLDTRGELEAHALTFMANGVGWQVSGTSQAKIGLRDSNVVDNSQWGIESEEPLDARFNWWGDATGPNEIQRNPTGQGDNVTTLVDYRDWLTREDFLTLEVFDFKAAPLASGGVKFTWQTDRKVVAELVIIKDGKSMVYSGDNQSSLYHEVIVADLEQGERYELRVQGHDDSGAPFTKETGTHYIPVLGQATAPLTLPPIALGLLILTGLLCGTLLMRPWQDQTDMEGHDPDDEGFWGEETVPDLEGRVGPGSKSEVAVPVDPAKMTDTGVEPRPMIASAASTGSSEQPSVPTIASGDPASKANARRQLKVAEPGTMPLLGSLTSGVLEVNHEQQKNSAAFERRANEAGLFSSGVSRYELDAVTVSNVINKNIPSSDEGAGRLPRWVEPTVDPATGISPYQPPRPAKASLVQKLKNKTRRRQKPITAGNAGSVDAPRPREARRREPFPDAPASSTLLDRLLSAPDPDSRPRTAQQQTLEVEAPPVSVPVKTRIHDKQVTAVSLDMQGVVEELEVLGLHFSDWMDIDPLSFLEEDSSLALELKRYQDDPSSDIEAEPDHDQGT